MARIPTGDGSVLITYDNVMRALATEPAIDIKQFVRDWRDNAYQAAMRRVPRGSSGNLAREHRKLGPFKQGPNRFVARVANNAIYAKTIHDGRPTLTRAHLKNAENWALPSRFVMADRHAMSRTTPAVIRSPLGSRGHRRGTARVVSMIANRGQHAGHWIDLHEQLDAVKGQPWLERAGEEANVRARAYRRA